jgi:hypothetical protein
VALPSTSLNPTVLCAFINKWHLIFDVVQRVTILIDCEVLPHCVHGLFKKQAQSPTLSTVSPLLPPPPPLPLPLPLHMFLHRHHSLRLPNDVNVNTDVVDVVSPFNNRKKRQEEE